MLSADAPEGGPRHPTCAEEALLIALLILFLAVGLLLLSVGAGLGRRCFGVAAAVSFVAFAWAAWQADRVLSGEVVTQEVSWVPGLGLSLDLRLNGFALLFFLLVTGIGTLVQLYATQYFAVDRPGLHRLAGLLLLFTAAMY